MPQQIATRPVTAFWTVLTGLALAVFLCLAVAIDAVAFTITRTLAGQESGAGAYIAHRTGLRPAAAAAPVSPFAGRNLRAEPLTLAEKRMAARQLAAALPPPPDGWTLAPWAEGDFWRMFPDLASCREGGDSVRFEALIGGTSTDCPAVTDGTGAWVYSDGTDLLGIAVIYRRAADGQGARISSYSDPPVLRTLFGDRRGSDDRYAPARTIGPLRFGLLKSGRGGPTTRARATLDGDGTLSVYLFSTLGPRAALQMSAGLDTGLLAAMTAPIPR